MIAISKAWNGSLVVHSHGGPRLKTPKPDDTVEDLQRFSVTVAEGFAWAGSNYRRAGYGVKSAAEDTDNLRKLFWDKFGRPKRTLLHGQSWGGNVAAKTAELYGKGVDGKPVYDGVILTSGVLGGGTVSYDFRADLRAVYQYYCNNHPAAGETAYPLWQGQPVGSTLKNKDLDERLNACTGVGKPAAERTPQQARNLKNILAVTRIPERTLDSHLGWATFTFADIVNLRLGGKNPFSNVGVTYAGSDDDAALNRGVTRFAADPVGVQRLSQDSDLTGKLTVPTLTMHAIDDPTAFVELEHTFHDTVAKAGASSLLVQSFTDEHEHSKLATPEYAALLRAMTAWIDNYSPEKFAASVDESLDKLKTDHVDLLLLHWPADKVSIADQIEMLNAVQVAGKTRFIGVSNQNVAQLKESIALSKAPIVTNQVEVHPYLDQTAVARAAKAAGVAVTAYYGMADGAAPRDPVLREIGARHGKSAAQVTLRWLVQEGFVALSKTAKPERVDENIDIFDFQLSDEDLSSIRKLARPDGRLVSPLGLIPAWDV